MDLGRYNEICNLIKNDSLIFRHIVKVGYYSPVRYGCEMQRNTTIFYGNYGQNEDILYNSTRYIQTPDANEGYFRLVHINNSKIIETVVIG